MSLKHMGFLLLSPLKNSMILKTPFKWQEPCIGFDSLSRCYGEAKVVKFDSR
ncbi:hypothetical protein CDL15_Pgr003231 [Punica granatum]|uniref:Uncharacterized protein n=1 Tax=Punica granatum TaxID=22663 RepID=A0A218X306_PUNGR|nr:hypothetical protein CDL15_Pgr003231 [Punica granatum]